MPCKNQYDLVQNDEYDTRIPVYPDEAFLHGITFQAKFIGCLDVPRPTSRVEIVSAMRRIRYEFKTKRIKKKKVTIKVSRDGVEVTLRKKKKRKHWLDESVLMSNPIYRIFYVSHDSQDLKIFSYIARDGSSDVFKCAVFKSNKKSQAMTVVRTVGQAFEVCHKWAITEPKNNENADEQDTLTQDLVSDRLSDITSDKPKKDVYSEGASDKLSLPDDDSFKDLNSLTDNNNKANKQQQQQQQHLGNGKNTHLEALLPPPLHIQSTRKSPLTTAETYVAPHIDVPLTAGSGSGGSSSIPAAGSALSVHHELQLLREQLDQQSQQTQAACAQLQLAREQLAAEQSARMEAQARTHQLLVHNRELLDHIAALVAHLQGSDKAANLPQSSPHLTMPQQQHPGLVDGTGGVYHDADANSLDHSPVLAATLGLNPQGLIENRAVTSGLPASPLRASFNPPTSGVFNFAAAQPQAAQQAPQLDFALEAQLLQRLQALSGYTPPSYYNQNLAFLPGLYANPMVNNNYTLQTPPQKKFTPSPLPVRHSFQSSPVMDKRLSPARTNDVYQSQQSLLYQSQQNLQQAGVGYSAPNASPQRQLSQQNLNQNNQNNNMQLLQQQAQQQAAACRSERNSEPRYIKPLSQMGTLTTTDPNGRVRVIVPIPSNHSEERDDAADLLSSLRLDSACGPGITRSTSEKVPNRSELMSQLSAAAKVERWFEMLEPTSISRPESGFVSGPDQNEEQDPDEQDEEQAILEGTKSLLSKLSAKKQRKLLGLKLGKVTTF